MNGGEPDLFFLDTNVLVYAQATAESRKQPIASALLQEAIATERGCISTQVVQEFLNVATRRAVPAFSIEETTEYMHKVLWPLCRHFPSSAFYERALQLRNAVSLSFYDALIVAAALELDCQWLVSEDMQHGRVIQGLRVVNPFLAEGGWPGPRGTDG